MTVFRWSAAAVVVALCLSPSLRGKGPTTRIVIAAPSLPAALEITEPASLDRFAVWAGRGTSVGGIESSEGFIIDWSAGVLADRVEALPRYTVSFYSTNAAKPSKARSEHLTYVVLYEPDAHGGRGYVYLPGKGDEACALNVSTIFRGVEGHWFRASEERHRTYMRLMNTRR
jgi:hypothetical protein